MNKKTYIAMVPSPGLSHLIPQVEFAKQLLQQHNEFIVTFIIPTLCPLTPSMQQVLNTLPPNIEFIVLPQVKHLPEINLEPATQMKLIVKHSIPFLQEEVKSLISKTNLVSLIFGLFSTDAHEVAKQFNLSSYLFYASGALSLSFFLTLPNLDDSVSSEAEFLESAYETVNIPGCVIPFHIKDIPEIILCERSNVNYKIFLEVCQKLTLVDGFIISTFTDLEPDVIRVLQEKEKPCVYPVGPIIRNESNCEDNINSMCLRWLENQPPNSVLYVCFGSGGTVSHEQLNELAFGLELSGKKFLWVVRVPSKDVNSAYFVGAKDDPLEYLPNGFLERNKENGLVVPSWAPQVEILGHGSIGGFLSHCGWGSTLETVVNGVPVIAWPLFAEQRMNARLLTDVLKVAVRPKVDDESGIVKREEVAKCVKRIMEGDESLEIQKRIKELSDGAAVATSEHGSSRKALSSLALKLHNF
ncbi:putative hydroquinone glucosyltransferase [Medicago truncatula]|uniref:Glycosyltransferase n=1 Tax=Medicago truncatula TaxID=3880 RepID=A0A072TJW1_MEDTR|nr:UDP-glucosyltransferase family protein [Medicago truncatula]RHN38619.1 putative hydroquinone glucosyltransferase [Medicago truncatula]